MLRIHCLLHSDLGGEIHLPDWAASRGHEWTTTLVPQTQVFPQPEDVDCLVILGGPMSAWDDDKYPWLVIEKRLLRTFVDAEKPVLGICLGAQLLAGVLGARTYSGPCPEIGWFSVTASERAHEHPVGALLPERFETFLWHGDTFDLPDGALGIAGSTAFANQAFIWNRVLALQFHLEVRPDWVGRLVQRDAAQLVEADHVQSAAAVLGQAERLYRANNALMDRLLDRWLEAGRYSEP